MFRRRARASRSASGSDGRVVRATVVKSENLAPTLGPVSAEWIGAPTGTASERYDGQARQHGMSARVGLEDPGARFGSCAANCRNGSNAFCYAVTSCLLRRMWKSGTAARTAMASP